jgi:cytochrome c oxidase subunit 3
MGQLVPYRRPRTAHEVTALIGMALFLGAWAMMFAALLFAYALVRARAPHWPPLGEAHLPRAWPALNTVLLLAQGALAQWGLALTREGVVRGLGARLAGAAAAGAAFLFAQCVLFAHVHARGLAPDTSPYGSVFYMLTGFHALHVAVGAGAFAVLALRASRGAFTAARHQPLQLWTLYAHFVTVVWGVVLVAVFLT